jgi:porphobilinogen deaminase
MPCGAYATITANRAVHIDAMLATVDGTHTLRTALDGDDANRVGVAAARRILDDLGGTALLASAGDGSRS